MMQHYYHTAEYQTLIQQREALASEHIEWMNEWTRRTDLMLAACDGAATLTAMDYRDELHAVMENIRQRQNVNVSKMQAIRKAYDNEYGLTPA